jgi:hypothetical protein
MRVRYARPSRLDLTAPGGVEALLALSRARFGDTRMGPPEDPPADPPPPVDPPADPPPPEDKGFPADTPVAEMTDAQAAAYWKHQARKHENTAKSRSDYDDLKKKAAEADKLRKAAETEAEKAIREAREAGEAEAAKKAAPKLVAAEFRAAARGLLDRDQIDDLLEDLNLEKFLTDTGEVDVDKVEKRVKALAPKKDESGKRRMPDLGQGKRQSGSERGAAGLAEAEKRFAKSTSK